MSTQEPTLESTGTTTITERATATTVGQKRKAVAVAADALGRLATSTSRGGRGAVTGWTSCPLCGRYSGKKFAAGRGIAAHLQAVHAPWKAGRADKAQRRKRRRLAQMAQRKRAKRRRTTGAEATATSHSEISDNSATTAESLEQGEDCVLPVEAEPWEPTDVERAAWDARVLELVQQAEDNLKTEASASATTTSNQTTMEAKLPAAIVAGVDRTGKAAFTYRASLPRFLQAAADGLLDVLKSMLQEATTTAAAASASAAETTTSKNETTEENVFATAAAALLQTRDRHGSTAEHWAAGNGHLPCLQWLVEQRHRYARNTVVHTQQQDILSSSSQNGRQRRRDGKTPLHYAARNGQMTTAAYLWKNSNLTGANVNAVSGDGTTPLHLACFGGHYDMVVALHEQGAAVHATNAYQCTAAHWVSMSKSTDHAQFIQLCTWLAKQGVDFGAIQSQGHSAVHKAAQHGNTTLLKWMATHYFQTPDVKRAAAAPDIGGHTPWEILRNVGGDAATVEWLFREFGPNTD